MGPHRTLNENPPRLGRLLDVPRETMWIEGVWVPIWELTGDPPPEPHQRPIYQSRSVLNNPTRQAFVADITQRLTEGTYDTPSPLEVADAMVDWQELAIRRYLRSAGWAVLRMRQLDGSLYADTQVEEK